MSNLTKLLAVFIILLLFLGIPALCNKNARATDLEYSDGVYAVRVTDHSSYIIDTRYGKCFYETMTQNGVGVVEIDCLSIKQKLGK